MANPDIVKNDNRPLFIGDQVFEPHTILAGENPQRGELLGEINRVVGAVTPDGGNTGDGTITEFALAAGGPAQIGNYEVECIEEDAGGAKTPGTVTPDGGNTGDGTASAATLGTDAKEGTYTLTCIEAIVNGGRFEVKDPDGNRLADLYVGVAYVSTQINLTISDGATDFIVGDKFTLAVTITDGGKFKLTDPSGVILKDDILLPGTPGGNVVVIVGGITFKITDGATDFATGDKFTLAVAAGSLKLKVFDNTAVDGSQIPKFVTAQNLTNVADQINDVCKSGRINTGLLVLPGGVTLQTIIDGQTVETWLKNVGIITIDTDNLDFYDNE
jgi:hypothetical protein